MTVWGLIVAGNLERLARVYAILIPPVLARLFVGVMVLEAEYALASRMRFFGTGP